MISCIICSRQADISAELKENIASTIGCEYELVVIDNSKNEHSIFSAYNEGVRRAIGDILCFMHEDIIYHTNDWGKLVNNVLRYESIGLVGVIGSQYLPNKMASWWLCGATKGQILQGYKDQKGNYFASLDGENIQQLTDTVVVDGLWFCMNRTMFSLVRFDENTYNSYHCYDVDISMQVLSCGRRVVVVPDLLIEHRSLGNVTTSYYNQLQVFYDKWQANLPTWRGINITEQDALWASKILDGYQTVVCRNVVLENSKAYRLGRGLLSTFKRLKR